MKESAHKLWIRIAILVPLIGILFFLLLSRLDDPSSSGISSSLVNSETVYFMIALCIAVPLGLTVLLTALILNAAPLFRRLPRIKKQRRRKTSRFPNLTRIDAASKTVRAIPYDRRSLGDICADFRNFSASRLGLYYDIADIRRFVAGMGMSHLVILRGMSGTGKTSLAYAAGEYFGNPSTIVPIQPMWKERSDIIGYFNEFTKRFNETTLLCKLYEAGGNDDVYITVLDEVNISRIEYYFAEFLSLLEIPDPSKRALDVVSDSWDTDPQRLQNGKLILPENMWFVGTANNDDSTFSISDKVYDRAAVLDLDKKSQPFQAHRAAGAHISYSDLVRRFNDAQSRYPLTDGSRDKLAKLDAYISQTFRISFGNRIMGQLQRYVPIMIACGGTEIGALDDILARKILRKLEQQSPILLKSEIPGLLATLDDLFGKNALPQSQAYLLRLQRNS
ncbi:MAG: hypothetical protein E7436_06365 [Ruminococcaceae bacterium]|nr:hypothetical protein [Oscillospiraceae bacterium]